MYGAGCETEMVLLILYVALLTVIVAALSAPVEFADAVIVTDPLPLDEVVDNASQPIELLTFHSQLDVMVSF